MGSQPIAAIKPFHTRLMITLESAVKDGGPQAHQDAEESLLQVIAFGQQLRLGWLSWVS